MAILQYPGLDQVEDEGTKSALRLLWDEIRTLDDREEVSEGLTTTELDQVQEALQWKGSHQLDVAGLLGKLQGIQKSMTRVHGIWSKTAITAGTGAYDWDTSLLESVPGAFKRTNGNTELRFMVAGTYLIIARLYADGHASGVRFHGFFNAPVTGALHHSWWDPSSTNVAVVYSGILLDIFRVVPGDYYTVSSVYSNRAGYAGGSFTALYAIRLV